MPPGRLLIADDDRVLMPGGTGIEALKKLRQSMKTSQIPVVVLSGSIDAKDEPAVLELGAAGARLWEAKG